MTAYRRKGLFRSSSSPCNEEPQPPRSSGIEGETTAQGKYELSCMFEMRYLKVWKWVSARVLTQRNGACGFLRNEVKSTHSYQFRQHRRIASNEFDVEDGESIRPFSGEHHRARIQPIEGRRSCEVSELGLKHTIEPIGGKRDCTRSRIQDQDYSRAQLPTDRVRRLNMKVGMLGTSDEACSILLTSVSTIITSCLGL